MTHRIQQCWAFSVNYLVQFYTGCSKCVHKNSRKIECINETSVYLNILNSTLDFRLILFKLSYINIPSLSTYFDCGAVARSGELLWADAIYRYRRKSCFIKASLLHTILRVLLLFLHFTFTNIVFYWLLNIIALS